MHDKGSFAVYGVMPHGKGCFAVHYVMPHGKVCVTAAHWILCRASSLCRAHSWIFAVLLDVAVRCSAPLSCVFLCRGFFCGFAVRPSMPCVAVATHDKAFFAVRQRMAE
jgi:hypothetical protein